MAIEVQRQTCQPGQTVQFTFQNQLQNWVLGIYQFNFTYGQTTNHWIETLSISLQGTMPEAAGTVGNVLEVVAQVQMMDHTGHSIDAGESSITVVCVAMTGNVDQNTLLTNVSNVAPDQSPTVQLPGTSDFSVLETCLSGLCLSYDSIDHMYQGAEAGCGISLQGGSGLGALNATANIWDGSGHQAVTATIDAGVLASVDEAPGFAVWPVTVHQVGPNETESIFHQFAFGVGGAVALIQGFTVRYASGDHCVQTLYVGASDLTIVNGDTVSLNGWAYAVDDEGHYTDISESSVDLLVIAVPPISA